MNLLDLDSLHCFVEIVDGVFGSDSSIVVEYYLNAGREWKNAIKSEVIERKSDTGEQAKCSTDMRSSGAIHGCTRRSICDANNRCTFNHLFELNFEFDRRSNKELIELSGRKVKTENSESGDKISNNETDLRDAANELANLSISDQQSDWPFFELRAWSIESKRKTFIGLAFLDLPAKAGQYYQQVDIWSLNENHPRTKLMQHFLHYSLEPNTRLSNKNDWRISLNSQVAGSISMKLNLVVCKHVPTHLVESEELDAIDEKIQRVVVAFRDARRRMQVLLKEKENLEIRN